MPLAHHDVLCHLKSTTHCTTCVVASSGETPLGARKLRFREVCPKPARAHAVDGLYSALVSRRLGRSPPQA